MSTVHIMLGSPDHRRKLPPKNSKDYYIGVDRGSLILMEHDYQMNLALGDFDSITEEEKLAVQSRTDKFQQFNADKDDTDAELSLVYAMELFHSDQIIFYGWSGGRLDHLISILMLVLQPRFSSVISKLHFENQTNTVRFYQPGEYLLQKESDKDYCSVIGMTPLKAVTLNEGFKYTLDSRDFDYPIALISNEFVQLEAILSFSEGLIAFVQSRD
ncbi:thiamine diphosphokinase [Marinilactibacillus piezotolerans]|uniref:thiamine diphosphokinase n=1 Tax=Marinilactibacillus piezotolerans TaxID=258723 RepID=UPI0009B115AD|nr:thiamine diphosphokinase [Marinilactibacillus piezotolerans]